MNRFFVAVLLSIIFSVYTFADNVKIKIAAASNLSIILEELKSDFLANKKGVTIDISYNSSGKLASQIIQGADFDIFMSADMDYPEKLYKDGYSTEKPKLYAIGKLILFTVKDVYLKNWVRLLKEDGIKTISIVNPDTGPYGRSSIEALTATGIMDDVRSKLIKTESVSGVIQQVIAASDIGITAKSLIFSDSMKKFKMGINWIEIDHSLYSPINQGMIILKKNNGKNAVRNFFDYIISNDAKIIFKKYGYDFSEGN